MKMKMKMTMKKKAPLALVLVTMVVLTAAGGGSAAAASSCNAKVLAPCVPSLTGVSGTPTAECCGNMRAQQQQGCLCQFASNPAYARYVGNSNTRRTIAACGIAPPRCKPAA